MDIKPRDLWEFGNELDSLYPPRLEEHSLNEVGLIADDFAGYATPANAEVFARTGGDGVHFTRLTDSAQPIVMVVPMKYPDPYVVVGQSLHDFLRLGCRCGYFGLEQLVYDWKETVDWIREGDDREDYPQLAKLAEHFKLEPHADPASHLVSLRDRYLKLAVPPPDYP